jgi:hypothetical protein
MIPIRSNRVTVIPLDLTGVVCPFTAGSDLFSQGRHLGRLVQYDPALMGIKL